jgi:hypothetical protein
MAFNAIPAVQMTRVMMINNLNISQIVSNGLCFLSIYNATITHNEPNVSNVSPLIIHKFTTTTLPNQMLVFGTERIYFV